MRILYSMILALIFVGTLVSNAQAESVSGDARAEAERRFTSGMRLVQREQWEQALEEFETSMRLYPTQTTAFNRALCLRLLGRAPEAVAALEEIVETYGDDIGRRRRIEILREMRRLEPLVGRITVNAGELQGALVLVDGREAGRTPLPRPLVVNAGPRRIEVRSEGFESFSQEVTVAGGSEQALDVSLQRAAAPGRIRVSLSLPGVRVSVDGREVGTTPLSEPVSASPGQRTVSASRPGYQPAQVQVQVIEGAEVGAELTMIPLTDLPAEVAGQLEVQVSQSDAEVLLDGAPLTGDAVPIGPHHIEVRLEGFETFARDVCRSEPATDSWSRAAFQQ